MEKVKLTHEQYGLLDDKLNHLGMSYREILEGFVDKESLSISSIFRSHFDIETLAKALYIGYELELTPEEKVKAYFDDVMDRMCKTEDEKMGKYYEGSHDGIITTLGELGIQIEGVNKR